MRVNIDSEEMKKLTRLYFLMNSYKNRWIFSYKDYDLAQYLIYFKLYQIEVDRFNYRYNPDNKKYKYNFANNFIEMED